MSQPTRVLIADDHPVVREGLAAMLGRRPSLAVVGQAQDGAQAVEMARRLQPNVVLMDLHMPTLDGVEATARIRQDLPQVQVLILTTFDHDSLILAGLRAGARGYVLKDAPAEDIVQAIIALARGDAYLQPPVAARVLEQLAPDGPAPRKPEGRTWASPYQAGVHQAGMHPGGGPDKLSNEVLTLSERERDVLAWLSRGLTSREIGERLSIAESTVKTHLAGLYSKLGVSDRAGAVAEAVRRGLLILR